MTSPAALLAALLFFAASLHLRAGEVGWYEMLSRIRTSSASGLIYPADGRQTLPLDSALNWGDPAKTGDSAHWLRILNAQVLPDLGGKARQEAGGSVLLADANAVQLHDLMTHPVKKGDYTGFDFLTQATTGLLTLSQGGFGGQLMGGNIHLEEDVPAQKLGSLMFFLCARLQGNYWSLSPITVLDKQGRPLKPELRSVLPVITQVSPAPPQPEYKVKAQTQD